MPLLQMMVIVMTTMSMMMTTMFFFFKLSLYVTVYMLKSVDFPGSGY